MKKFISIVLIFVIAVSCCSISVSAAENEDILLSRNVEVLANGDSITIELYKNAIQPRAGISGHRTFTYRNSAGTTIWNLTVNGTFLYNYGVSSTATDSSAVVNIYSNKADFISKNAYTSGNTAVATATVAYDTVSTTRSVSVSCDKYGNLY